jgi:hypothetical protein
LGRRKPQAQHLHPLDMETLVVVVVAELRPLALPVLAPLAVLVI